MQRPTFRTLLTMVAAIALVVPVSAAVGDQAATAEAATTLVADAGASAYVAQGELAHLRGTAYGASDEASYTWSAPEGVDPGAIQDPANPTAVIDTTGLAGSHAFTLTVQDGEAIAQDTVVVEVAAPEPAVERVNETHTDVTPSTEATGCTEEVGYDFDVAEGTGRIDAAVEWRSITSDYDLYLVDPSGKDRTSSTSFNILSRVPSESTGVANPEPGSWRVSVRECNATGDPEINTVVTTTKSPGGDPRPTIDADQYFTFVDGAPQILSGTVTGGTGPYDAGWDTDFDGLVDLTGTEVTASLPSGRHLVSFLVTDAEGYEARLTSTVLVGDAETVRREAVPLTVIGMSDSGINPYHSEFSAEAYPDPEVLELTRNFTRHPCEYITNYPCDSLPIPITPGEYFPERDTWMWNQNDWVKPGQLYWVPGTKIIGGIDSGGSTGATSGSDAYPLLDDNGHGTGSASVSAGNRYGYCPTCLIFMVEALDETVVLSQEWVDISSHSHGYLGGFPVGLLVKGLGGDVGAETRAATERGVNVLFAAGNGIGNAFDVPQRTYDSDQTGPNWNITVGALRRDNQGAIIGDGIPAHISSWGDGNLPSACRTGVHGQCAFGGTSAASPYTAGTFGTVLTRVRDALGDTTVGPRGQQVIAEGPALEGYLGDGALTRRELRAAMLKTAEPLNTSGEQNRYLYTGTYTGEEQRHAFEGYGAATPNAADRATAVLFGEIPMPNRSDADPFFQEDCENREALYGPFDRDGDGQADGCDKDVSGDPAFDGKGDRTTDSPYDHFWDAARDAIAPHPALDEPLEYALHRQIRIEAPRGDEHSCSEDDNESFADGDATLSDVEPCFDSRITSQVAAYRPKGMFPATDMLDGTLAPGSSVDVTAFFKASADAPVLGLSGVDSSNSQPVALTGAFGAVLVAGDREIGRSEEVRVTTSPVDWTQIDLTFDTVRPAFAGEHLTLYFHHLGFPGYAYGFEDDHVSSYTVTPAALGETDSQFGVTIDAPSSDVRPEGAFTLTGRVAFPARGPDDQKLAGFHPTVDKVQVSVGDPSFSDPQHALTDPTAGTYAVDLNGLGDADTVYVRAVRDRTPSPVASVTFADGGGSDGGSTDGATDGEEPSCDQADRFEQLADEAEQAGRDEQAERFREQADEARERCAEQPGKGRDGGDGDRDRGGPSPDQDLGAAPTQAASATGRNGVVVLLLLAMTAYLLVRRPRVE